MLTRRALLQGAAGLSASLVSFGAYALGIEPMLRLEIVRYAITPPGWPPGQRLRLVILSDFHACDPWMSLDRVRGLVQHANGSRRRHHAAARRLCQRPQDAALGRGP